MLQKFIQSLCRKFATAGVASIVIHSWVSHSSFMTWTNQRAISWWMQLRNAVSIFYWRVIHFIFTTLLHHVTKISQKTSRSTTLFLFIRHFHPIREKHYLIVGIEATPAVANFSNKHFLTPRAQRLDEFYVTCWLDEFDRDVTCWPFSRDKVIVDIL